MNWKSGYLSCCLSFLIRMNIRASYDSQSMNHTAL